jgi:hypothetical protein
LKSALACGRIRKDSHSEERSIIVFRNEVQILDPGANEWRKFGTPLGSISVIKLFLFVAWVVFRLDEVLRLTIEI